MTAAEYAYLGAEERTYPAYLAAPPDGDVKTLVGTPGMSPVVVVRAAGNEHLPEVPEDGLWATADHPATADTPADSEPAAAAKPAKTVKVVTS